MAPKEKPAAQAVAVKEETALAEAEYLKSIQGELDGAIEVRQELIKIPRLKINNAMSDSAQAGLGNLGEFVSPVRGVVFGPTVRIIPLIAGESASYMDKDTSKLICYSRDMVTNMDGQSCKACPYGEYWNDWGGKEERKVPKCKASIDVMVAVSDGGLPIDVMVLSFRKTSHPAGRALLNLIQGDPRRIPCGTAYTLVGKKGHNAQLKKDYWLIDPGDIKKEPLSLAELQAVFPLAKKMLDLKKAGRIQSEEDDSDDGDEEGRRGGGDVPF